MSVDIFHPFSFRAECKHDVDRFFNDCKAIGIKIDHLSIHPATDGWPDVEVDFRAKSTLSDLKQTARGIEDGHVLLETLRACPLAENSLSREWDDA